MKKVAIPCVMRYIGDRCTGSLEPPGHWTLFGGS
jgi:hypothetical protein